MAGKGQIVAVKRIESLILSIRGQRVMLDADLADIYGVPTRTLNQAVKRNLQRFPQDFMFQLTPKEKQEVITNCDHLAPLKFSPSMPYAFTEHGAIMAANMLNSETAVDMSVYVVRAFVRIKEFLATHKELAIKFAELEQKLASHDRQILEIIQVIKELMAPPAREPKKIGFALEKSKKS